MRLKVGPEHQNWNAGHPMTRVLCYLFRYSPSLFRCPTLREVITGRVEYR